VRFSTTLAGLPATVAYQEVTIFRKANPSRKSEPTVLIEFKKVRHVARPGKDSRTLEPLRRLTELGQTPNSLRSLDSTRRHLACHRSGGFIEYLRVFIGILALRPWPFEA
jgi:hypothetical protein